MLELADRYKIAIVGYESTSNMSRRQHHSVDHRRARALAAQRDDAWQVPRVEGDLLHHIALAAQRQNDRRNRHQLRLQRPVLGDGAAAHQRPPPHHRQGPEKVRIVEEDLRRAPASRTASPTTSATRTKSSATCPRRDRPRLHRRRQALDASLLRPALAARSASAARHHRQRHHAPQRALANSSTASAAEATPAAPKSPSATASSGSSKFV